MKGDSTVREKLSGLVSRLGNRFAQRDPASEPLWEADLEGRVGFAVGTGRCGTLFVAQVLEHEPEVAAVHERDPLLETFHRYCKWHGLPVDDEGYLHAMETSIRRDLAKRKFSVESSCHLSLSIPELEQRFHPKFALIVRHPRKVVRSHIGKGWYDQPIVQRRPDLALGYQTGKHFHHFLGRITPKGDELVAWNELTRVGKLAWFWATLNQAVLDHMASIPDDRTRTYRIEDFDHATYLEFARFVGFTANVTDKEFAKVRGINARKIDDDRWTDTEWKEFESFVTPLAKQLGYDPTR
jgi:hypothetical protein